jgi:flagellar protein FliT
MADTAYAAVLALSARMVAAARQDQWDAVASLEAERSAQIAALSINDVDALPVLKTLLTHTEEVRELARQQRDRLGSDLDQHQHRHRALSAYLHAGAE